MPKSLFAAIAFVLGLATVWSALFMLIALAFSLWAGVFWYGVSTTFFGALFNGWICRR